MSPASHSERPAGGVTVHEALRLAYRALVSCRSEDELLRQACHSLGQADGYAHVWVSQLDRAGKASTRASATHSQVSGGKLGQTTASTMEMLCQSALAQTIGRRVPLFLPGQGVESFQPWWVELGRLTSASCLISLPLTEGDRCLGALSILAVTEAVPEKEQVSQLQDLAHDLTLALLALGAQQTALSQQVQMRSLIEHSPDAILALDDQGNIEYANPAAEALLGQSAGQLLHTSLGLPSNTGEVIELEIPPKPQDALSGPRIVEMIQLKPSQEHRLTYTFLHDVTQRKKAQLLQARLGRILERTSNMFLVFDASTLALLDISEAGKQLLGYSNKQLRQLTLPDLKPAVSLKQIEDMLKPLRAQEISELLFETVLYDAAGAIHPLEVRLQTAIEDGKEVLIALVLDIADRVRHIAELEHRANYDALTDLPLRNILIDRLDLAIKSAARYQHAVAVLTVQLMNVGEISSLMGFNVGDRLIAESARRLQTALRNSDTVARLMDAKFIIVLPDVTIEHVRVVAAKVMELLQQPIELDNLSLQIEISLGAALYPEHGKGVHELLLHSDIALSLSRHQSNGLSIYSQEKTPIGLQRLSLIGGLRQAIEEKRLMLHYQPKLELSSGRITGVEALARWPHPDEGMIAPEVFIPIVEHSGLVRPFTHWVLSEAIAQQRRWQASGLKLRVAVNLSVHNLFDHSLPDTLAKLLADSQVDPGYLCLEVTESVLMSRPEQAVKVLSRLNELGVCLTIDDFGTGYSSLAYLKRLPVHELKIDQFFVVGLDRNAADEAIVRAAISLAHNLGLKVVAEGVESSSVMELLRKIGCDQAQGFAISQAMASDALLPWIRNWRA